MKQLTPIERRGRAAILELRKRTLSNGNPFLVYDDALPEGQYYLEYPDGDIKIVILSYRSNDYVVKGDLNDTETHELRRRLILPPVF